MPRQREYVSKLSSHLLHYARINLRRESWRETLAMKQNEWMEIDNLII